MRNEALIQLLRVPPAILLLAMWVAFSGLPIAIAQQASQTASPPASTRACSANPVLAPAGKKKGSTKSKHPLPPDPPPACIEVRGEAMEIQETLQSTARDRQWRVHENHASEDTWTCVRYLSPEEIEKYADTKVLLEQVQFEDGKVAILVRTTDLGDGYVRVQISAHFQGEGKSTDAAIKQPGTVWPLTSKGTLEQELIAALQTRYNHLE
jgi:hypothetical protein